MINFFINNLRMFVLSEIQMLAANQRISERFEINFTG